MSVWVWSFRAAAAGVHPGVDHRGRPLDPRSTLGTLAGKDLLVRGALISKQGDLGLVQAAGLGALWVEGRRANKAHLLVV